MTSKAHGFALLDLIFVCAIIGILASIGLPRLLLARQVASSASAIGSMRALNSAQLTYAITCGNGFYAPNLITLGTPPPAGGQAFISPDLGTSNEPVKSGYSVQLTATAYAGAPSSCNGLSAGQTGQGFKAAADPVEPGNPRFFGTNANGVIYEATATLFPTMPEVGAPPSGTPIH
jgi:type II secretory pathway pseudopilin PulG